MHVLVLLYNRTPFIYKNITTFVASVLGLHFTVVFFTPQIAPCTMHIQGLKKSGVKPRNDTFYNAIFSSVVIWHRDVLYIVWWNKIIFYRKSTMVRKRIHANSRYNTSTLDHKSIKMWHKHFSIIFLNTKNNSTINCYYINNLTKQISNWTDTCTRPVATK